MLAQQVNGAALAPIGDQPSANGSTFTAVAIEPDLPVQALTFSLDVGAPAGANIDPTTGVFTWTPTEAQGPGASTVTLRVTDNGSPTLSDAKTFTIVVNEVNTPPVLAPMPDITLHEGESMGFTVSATDGDVPAQTLTFSLDPGAPGGATIDPSTGLLIWTPTDVQRLGTYTIPIRVTDDGSPAMSAFNTITVRVRGTVNVTLAWNPSPDSDIAGYRLNYGVTSGTYTHALDIGTRTDATVTGLDEGVTYFFAAVSYNSFGLESQPSNEVSFTVPTSSAPQAPQQHHC